jgi:hypothetical protein
MTAIVTTLVGLAMVGTVMAQTQQSPSAPRSSPSSTPARTDMAKEKQVEGTVSKVDPLARTVNISAGLFGLRGATVQVADDTRILVQGQPSKLMDISEGDKVKATYESRDGKNLARSIEIEKKLPAQRSSRAPGSSTP